MLKPSLADGDAGRHRRCLVTTQSSQMGADTPGRRSITVRNPQTRGVGVFLTEAGHRASFH